MKGLGLRIKDLRYSNTGLGFRVEEEGLRVKD